MSGIIIQGEKCGADYSRKMHDSGPHLVETRSRAIRARSPNEHEKVNIRRTVCGFSGRSEKGV